MTLLLLYWYRPPSLFRMGIAFLYFLLGSFFQLISKGCIRLEVFPLLITAFTLNGLLLLSVILTLTE